MSSIIYRGDAPLVAQTQTVLVTGDDATTSYKATCNGKVVFVLGTGTGVNNTAAAWQAALAGTNIPEFKEITFTVDVATITATAATAGMPFTITFTASGGAGTITASGVTAGSGPSDVSCLANYSTGALPTTGDTLYLTRSSVPLLWNLQALAGVNIANLYSDSTLNAQVGLPFTNANGYTEYRQRYFQISPTTWVHGQGTGTGSGFFAIDLGSVQCAATIYGTGSPTAQGQPALYIKGTHASNTLTAQQGRIAIAFDPTSVSTFATVSIGSQNSPATDVTLTLGPGVTLTTINQNGGTLTYQSAVTTHTIRGGGTATCISTSVAITTLDIEDGKFIDQAGGTIGTRTIGIAGTYDHTQSPLARTITNSTNYGTDIDPNKAVTFTTPPLFPNGITGTGAAKINWGTNLRLQRS